jgi:hypothetical protein
VVITPRARAALVASFAIPLVTGCLDPAPGSHVIRGRHVELHEDPDALPICPGSIDDADNFVESTARFLGVPPPAMDYVYRANVPFDACGNRTACARTDLRAIESERWVDFHEIAHIVADTVGPVILTEGTANALTPIYYLDSRIADVQRSSFAPLLDSSIARTDPTTETLIYDGGAIFVRYLLHRFGAAPVLAWMHTTPDDVDYAVATQTFAREFGLPFTDVVTDFRTADPAPMRGPAQGVELSSCHRPGLALETVAFPQAGPPTRCAWSHSVLFDGAQPATVEVPEAGTYLLESSVPNAAYLALATCAAPFPNEPSVWGAIYRGEGAGPVLSDLPAGRTAVIVAPIAPSQSSIPAMPITWTVRRADAPGVTACDGASLAVVDVPPEMERLRWVGNASHWAETSPGWRQMRIRFRFASATRIRIPGLASWVPRPLACRGCGAASICTFLSDVGDWTWAPGDEADIELTLPPSSTFEYWFLFDRV